MLFQILFNVMQEDDCIWSPGKCASELKIMGNEKGRFQCINSQSVADYLVFSLIPL